MMAEVDGPEVFLPAGRFEVECYSYSRSVACSTSTGYYTPSY